MSTNVNVQKAGRHNPEISLNFFGLEREEDFAVRLRQYQRKTGIAFRQPSIHLMTTGSAKRIGFCRCKIVNAQTKRGLTTAEIDFLEVAQGLLMVKFARSSGGVSAFEELFSSILLDEECRGIILRSDAPEVKC